MDDNARQWKKDLGTLGLLLGLVVVLRGWLLTHTVVPARDTIGYIRYALEFERFSENSSLWETWQKVLRKNHQHPGYPLSILAVSVPVRYFAGRIDPNTMQLSAQLASNLAAVLLVLPMFFLGKMLFDRRIAFWGTLLFQVLPIGGHILSDGVSEPLFLLLVVSALLIAVQGFRDHSPARFSLCGLFCGLSYLTRPEGALVLIAAGATLVGVQLAPAWRRSWVRQLACAACLAGTAGAVGSMYAAATQKFTNKPSLHLIIHQQQVDNAPILEPASETPGVIHGSVWAAAITKGGSGPDRLVRGLGALGGELIQCYHYLGALLVLVGLLWQGPRLFHHSGTGFLAVYAGLHTVVLTFLVVNVGYVSVRHILILVLLGSYFLAAGLVDLPGRLGSAERRALSAEGGTRSVLRALRSALGAPRLALILVLLFAVACLPKTLQPLHVHRAGHLAAGTWLAQRVQPGDIVEDDHCWSHYYAGLVFAENQTPAVPQGHQPQCYLVMTRSKDAEIGQARQLNEAKIRDAQGQVVYHWPQTKAVEAARVVVYALPVQQCGPFLRAPPPPGSP